MQKTAAEVTLVKKLIRIAYEQPSERPALLPKIASLLKHGHPVEAGMAEIDKVAIAKETSDFVEWVVNTHDAMSPQEVEHFVNSQLGVETAPPGEAGAPKGPRFKHGDMVVIRADKHPVGEDKAIYDKFDGKVGTVTETEGLDVLVAFKGEPAPVRMSNGMKPRGVGIYKYTPPFDLPEKNKVEMVYFADPTATISDDQKVTVEKYMGKGQPGEKRSANYYTGFVGTAAKGANGFYFKMTPQQRVDPNSEGGNQFRAFNPAKGRLLYIGKPGKRPQGWKEALKAMQEQAEG